MEEDLYRCIYAYIYIYNYLDLGLDDVDDLLGAVHIPAALLQVVVEPVSCIRRGEVDEGVAEVARTPADFINLSYITISHRISFIHCNRIG